MGTVHHAGTTQCPSAVDLGTRALFAVCCAVEKVEAKIGAGLRNKEQLRIDDSPEDG